MKVLSVIGLLLVAAIIATVPISPQVTPQGLELRIDQAQAQVTYGRARRVARRSAYRAAVYGSGYRYGYGYPAYSYGYGYPAGYSYAYAPVYRAYAPRRYYARRYYRY